jgi:penicillin-binding protein 1C
MPRRTVAASLAFCAVATALWLRLGPLPPGLLDEKDATSTVVLDRHGVPLYEARTSAGTRGVRMTAGAVPDTLAAATIAAEDHRFHLHPGVDPVSVLRAAWRNLREGQIVEGGSTITQQVAKLLLNRRISRRQRGWGAKMHEAIIALRLEHRFSKGEILAMYLSLASYGNQIAGAERASEAYFGRPSGMLTPAQAAFLAGLPQRPSGFNPYRSLESAKQRQRFVLGRMEATGMLSAAQATEARNERLTFVPDRAVFVAPHFVEMALAETGSDRPGRLETTIDSALQRAIAGIIESHRRVLERHGAANVAVIVLANARAEWLAWEGSGNYFDAERGGAINGPLALRQPGSALKPFTYALGFEEGFTPASVLPDVPTHFPTAEPGVLYSPRNYDGRYRGPLLARRALAGSENIPAVALASALGVPKLLRFLSRAGLGSFEKTAAHYGLGVTLGNAEVKLSELVAASAAFARGGEWLQPTWRKEPGTRETRRLVSPRTAFWIADILSDADAREYIFGRGGSLEFPFPVAVKTGTSQAYHDNWTIGYTREVTVGVWVGNFDRRPLRNSSGITGAAPIFHAVMLAAHQRVTVAQEDTIVPRDSTVAEREICALSGMSSNAWCPVRRREWLPAVASERDVLPCGWHHLSEDGLLVIWPPQYRAWAEQNDRLALAPAPPIATSAAAVQRRLAPPAASLEIASPPAGATYLIDPTLRPEFQTLPLRAVTDAAGPIEWRINGRRIGTSSDTAPLEWSLVPGRHLVVARDARGRTAEAAITVK